MPLPDRFAPRVALYARFSSDLQSPASIEDQLHACTAHAERHGWTIVGRFSDHGISGATLRRPGLMDLMEALDKGGIDIVLTEGLDRLSRDQEHVVGLFKKLKFKGVRLVTLSENDVSELHVGLKGTMNALFLCDLAQKTRRGMEGRIRQGKAGGGRAYGYRVVRALDAAGMPVRGDREIDPREAAVVERIFRDFAAGHSPNAIAKALNAEGVPGPSGGAWQDTTLRGHAGRATGILRNRLYIGQLVWNRTSFSRHPETERRVSRVNPQEAWVIEEVPHLRIIDQDLWTAVEARLTAMRDSPRSLSARRHEFWKQRRAGYLLTGKVVCGVCGSPYCNVGKDYLACSGARKKGTCSNSKAVRRSLIEAQILDALRTQLMQPDLLKEFTEAYVAEVNRQRSMASGARGDLEREHARISRQIDALVDAILEGASARAINAQLKDLEDRKAAVEERLNEPLPDVVRLHPNLPELYRRKVEGLQQALSDPACHAEALEIVRGLIEQVLVSPGPDGTGHTIDLHGDLAAMLTLGSESTKPASGEAGFAELVASSVKVVAGA